MTQNPLLLRRVKTLADKIEFEKMERESFPMLRRQSDRVFSSNTAVEDIITKKTVEQFKEDVGRREETIKKNFDNLKREHKTYIAKMQVYSLMKEKRIAELEKKIKELMDKIDDKDQIIALQKEMIARTEAKVRKEETMNFTKTIARIVHDLKGPLTGVQGSLDVLQEYSFTEDVKFLIDMAKEGSNDLRDMVEDILITNKITHNAVALNKKHFSLSKQIKRIVSQNINYARVKGKEIVFECSEDIYIFADELKIKRAIGNLVSNAVKYGRKATKINLTETENEVKLQISDDGEGFNEEIRKKVFSDNEMTTSDLINGNGFGLTNAKKFIEMHGGTIKLAKNSIVGTTFDISLPKK